MFKLALDKAEEPAIKLPTSAGSSKKQESSRKTSISALLTMPKNAQTTAQLHSSHMLVKLKILQATLQQYVNHEIPDVQSGFRKDRGTRDQIANIRWVMEKAREFQKNIYFCFINYVKAFDYVDHNKRENSSRDGNTRPPDLPPKKPVCWSRSNS